MTSAFGIPANFRQWLILVWLCFILRGLFYCSLLPLWEGFDEWAHFAVVQHISVTGRPIVDRTSKVSKEINASLTLAPLPRGMTLILPPGVTHDEYWMLSAEERHRRESALQTLDPGLSREIALDGMPAYEASQPPLYYWIAAIALRLFDNASLLTRVWTTRLLSFIIGSFAIPIGFILTFRVFKDAWAALSLTALVALLPELALNLARVSNESLSIVLYSALLLGTVTSLANRNSLLHSCVIGTLLGLGLLTKAYFLTAVPALGLVYLGINWRKPEKMNAILTYATVVFTVAFAIGGWWYVRNYMQTATVSGLDEPQMLANVGLVHELRGVFRVNWGRALAVIFLSHVWYGGWSLLALPHWIYYLSFAGIIAVFLGFVKVITRTIDSTLGSLLAFYAFFWIGQVYQILLLFLSKESSTALGGWYLYSLIWAEMILAIIGLFGLTPVRFRQLAVAAIAVLAALLDVFGVHFISIPYYGHSDSLFNLDISRLLLNKPAFLGISSMLCFWTLYLVSTLLIAAVGTVAARKMKITEYGHIPSNQ
jgi:4-amino-4-deoxy-L-arabinose transferase-like glycosyltransferase